MLDQLENPGQSDLVWGKRLQAVRLSVGEESAWPAMLGDPGQVPFLRDGDTSVPCARSCPRQDTISRQQGDLGTRPGHTRERLQQHFGDRITCIQSVFQDHQLSEAWFWVLTA